MANAIKEQYGKEDFQFEYLCPTCRDILTYEDEPYEFMYCQRCRDYVYDPEIGDNMGMFREDDRDGEDR